MVSHKRNREYYAVIHGCHLTTPTIFSSWGDAHPLVDGFPNARHKAFVTLEAARRYMTENSIRDHTEIIKAGAGKTTPLRNTDAYYAVANGRSPGITRYYYGHDGTEMRVVNFPGACHKRFRTEEQAEAFIADWDETQARLRSAGIKRDSSEATTRPIQLPQQRLEMIVSRLQAASLDMAGLAGQVQALRLDGV